MGRSFERRNEGKEKFFLFIFLRERVYFIRVKYLSRAGVKISEVNLGDFDTVIDSLVKKKKLETS